MTGTVDEGTSDAPSAVGVQAATEAAVRVGFGISCDPGVGRVLSVLAGAVQREGTILELGTGVGVGLGWIVSGLAGRTDVGVLSVEVDSDTGPVAAREDWPSFVGLEVGDALDVLRRDERAAWPSPIRRQPTATYRLERDAPACMGGGGACRTRG